MFFKKNVCVFCSHLNVQIAMLSIAPLVHLRWLDVAVVLRHDSATIFVDIVHPTRCVLSVRFNVSVEADVDLSIFFANANKSVAVRCASLACSLVM